MVRKGFVSATFVISAGIFLSTALPALAVEQPATSVQSATAPAPVSGPASSLDDITVRLRVPFYSPLFSNVPVASVGDEQITMADLQRVLMTMHEKVGEGATPTKKAFLDPLQRLINVKVMAMEARSMELDKLPEVKASLDKYSEAELRKTLFLDHVKDLKADPKEVEKVYKSLIREWKVRTAIFKKEKDAKKFEQEVKGGKSFDVLRGKAIKDGLADQLGQNEELYANGEALGPTIAGALADVKAGTVSPIIPVTNGFVLVKVVDVKEVENPELKERAQGQVLSQMRLKSLQAYKEELWRRYTKENKKLLKSLDLEAPKPGIQKLGKDKRVLVSIKGEKPVTVADLVDALQAKFYHGIENAVKEKRLNKEKHNALDEIVSVRLFRRAALEKHLDQLEEYKRKVEANTDSTLFGMFIEKVVKPDVTYTTHDLKAYYDEHVSEFKSPETFQLDGIAFKKGEAAQSAIDKLRHGMDYQWLKSNADNQVDKGARGLLHFEGNALPITSYPADMQKILTGAKTGEYKLYEAPEGLYYVLYVAKAVPAQVQSLEEVKNVVGPIVVGQHQAKLIEDWFKKLRAGYPVKIYLEEQ